MALQRRLLNASREWFRGRRRPSRWSMLLLGIGTVSIAAQLYGSRGPLVAALALVVYGGVFGAGGLRWDRTIAWSADHPRLDGLLLVPLLFLCLALVTHLALGWCALVAVATWLVIAPLGQRNRRRRAAAVADRSS